MVPLLCPVQDLVVRPFASLAASAQFGWFQHRAADFTSLSAKLDLGLPAPKQLQPGRCERGGAGGSVAGGLLRWICWWYEHGMG
jgi:hypothetical protein